MKIAEGRKEAAGGWEDINSGHSGRWQRMGAGSWGGEGGGLGEGGGTGVAAGAAALHREFEVTAAPGLRGERGRERGEGRGLGEGRREGGRRAGWEEFEATTVLVVAAAAALGLREVQPAVGGRGAAATAARRALGAAVGRSVLPQ